MVDFNKLHEPYKSVDSPSPEAQLKWLTTKCGIPQDIAARAMLQVYMELEGGRVIVESEQDGRKYSSGWNLCQYLRKIATEIFTQASSAYLKALSDQDELRRIKIRDTILKKQPKTWWNRIKAVFSDPYKNL